MSHYTVDYGNTPEPEKRARAIEDIRRWFDDDERFARVEASLRQYLAEGATLEHFRLALSFAGVRGYPVQAWFDQLTSEQQEQAS